VQDLLIHKGISHGKHSLEFILGFLPGAPLTRRRQISVLNTSFLLGTLLLAVIFVPLKLAAKHRRALPAIGRGAVLYPELLPNAALPLDVSAATLGAVAIRHLLAGDPIPPTPLYLRRPDAHEPGTPKSALADGGTS